MTSDTCGARVTDGRITSNRALFVKNLTYTVTPEELFELFGKFGHIRFVRSMHLFIINGETNPKTSQIRQGIANNTKGTAFVVYEDVMDSKAACDKLNGFNFQNRYLVVLYHQVRSFLDLLIPSILRITNT
jgi:RNA recognition motif-containing protein